MFKPKCNMCSKNSYYSLDSVINILKFKFHA